MAAGINNFFEIIFLIEEDPDGGFTARGIGSDVFAEADDLASLRATVRDAVSAHFSESERPSLIRLRYVREEVLTL
jgi:hypothetical protein